MTPIERPSAGLIYGPSIHYLDHLAPLCRVMGIPLICTEEEIAEKARRYYPGLSVSLSDYLTIGDELISHFDILFTAMPRPLFDEIFFFVQKFNQKKIHTIWCPHGNSDKGKNSFFMEGLKDEEVALVYGQKMIDFMKEKGVFDTLKTHVITGNYRYQFYLKHKPFYDAIASQEILRKLPKAEKTLLYAPTWQDAEKSSSFYTATPHLIKTLPPHWNLIIKPHPNLKMQDELAFEEMGELAESNPRITMLTDFPPIYPLLNVIDTYIGDLSSIGYDFLTFDKPLFFLMQTQDPNLYLTQCGISITPDQYPRIYQIIEEVERFEVRNFSEKRKEAYDYTFGQPKDLDLLRQEIARSFSAFPEPEWNFF